MPPFHNSTINVPSPAELGRSLFLGYFFAMFAYGIHFTLYIICMSSFYSRGGTNTKANRLYMCYITFNFILGSIGNAFTTLLCDRAFIDGQNRLSNESFASVYGMNKQDQFPGGPLAFFANVEGLVIPQISFIVYTINTWSQDGMLLYRFYVIFGERLAIVVLPLCLYLISIGFSCLLLGRLARTTDVQVTLHSGIVFWSISIGTTILLTTLIVLRLIATKIQTNRAMKHHARVHTPYLSVSATLMESAFLYSAVGGLYLVFYAKGSMGQGFFLSPLGQATSIAPLLIAWRVAQRRAWTSDTLQSTRQTVVSNTSDLRLSQTTPTPTISSSDPKGFLSNTSCTNIRNDETAHGVGNAL